MQSTGVVLLNAGYVWKFIKPSRNIFTCIYKCMAMEGNAFLIVKVVLWFVCVVFCTFNNHHWNSYYTCISISESIVGL